MAKPDRIIIRMGKDGVKALNYPETGRILRHIRGRRSVRRLSHILPTSWARRQVFRALRLLGDEGRVAEWTRGWDCLWNVDLSPVGGPVLGPFHPRSLAIASEVDWLARNYFRSDRSKAADGESANAEADRRADYPAVEDSQG